MSLISPVMMPYINGHYSYVGTYFFDLHETGTELGGYEQLSLSAGRNYR